MSQIDKYEKLFSKVINNKVIDPASYFEFYVYQLLRENKELNLIGKIKHNFKLKDGLPLSHAPPGPDIEVFGKNIAFICECSLKLGIRQFDDEHESVSRHLEEFNIIFNKKYSQIFCFFIAPKISKEIVEWYYSLSTDILIIPITIKDFLILMTKLINKKLINYEKTLIDLTKLVSNCENSEDWSNSISKLIHKL